MIADSGLLQSLSQHSFSPDVTPLCIYGDPAHLLRVHLQRPFKGARWTPAEQQFSKREFQWNGFLAIF